MIKPEHRQRHMEDADRLWSDMKNYEGRMKMSWDGYLKLFQLRENVDLAEALNADPFDAILVDEAQVCKRGASTAGLPGDETFNVYWFLERV